MGSQVNSENNEFYPTLADNNNLYYTMESNSGLGKDDIYCCKWDGTNYSKPILLDTHINSDGYEFNAFISRDEQMLIYTKYNTDDGFGSRRSNLTPQSFASIQEFQAYVTANENGLSKIYKCKIKL